MTDKDTGETVTSCTGSKVHPVETDIAVGESSPGLVTIGEKQYLITLAGERGVFQQTKGSGGKRYDVRDTHPMSCQCGDFKFRSNGGRLPCKHIRSLAKIRANLKECQS